MIGKRFTQVESDRKREEFGSGQEILLLISRTRFHKGFEVMEVMQTINRANNEEDVGLSCTRSKVMSCREEGNMGSGPKTETPDSSENHYEGECHEPLRFQLPIIMQNPTVPVPPVPCSLSPVTHVTVKHNYCILSNVSVPNNVSPLSLVLVKSI
ncbi:uncharacterized protein EV154DRAFT_486693 [Mucor mucedo]|uniref:uncharacterized protein n=1 Tax=Mucor mucedo TaxID=29922 RepID=UPI00221E693E|nr:uncharacterized protein EV154DRAFT_486693 [Mucor mucedo]KAI7875646.1 hypothetical protein EV154DRAFT_486693 [Mucor mucedo]